MDFWRFRLWAIESVVQWDMWTLLLGFALANPPPIAAPCCGGAPIEHATGDQVSVTAPEQPAEVRELKALVSQKVVGGAVRQSVCDSVGHCGRFDCDQTEHPAHYRTERSKTYTVGEHSLWVEVVGMGTFVCYVDRWAVVVEHAESVAWVELLSGGGGTKGGARTKLKQVLPLDGGRFWIEIQKDVLHTLESRQVALYGFVVGLKGGEPVVLADEIPVWVDGVAYGGPRQIDVDVKGDTLEITARTELLAPIQVEWLGAWKLESTASD